MTMTASGSTHPSNTRTSNRNRGAVRVPLKCSRNDPPIMHGDHLHHGLSIIDNNSADVEQNYPYRRSSLGTKPNLSEPLPRGGLEVPDIDIRDSMVYLGPPKHEDHDYPGFPSPARSNVLTTTRTSGPSQVRFTPSDATRPRYVPRGPVARVRSSMPSTTKSSKSQSHQKTSGHSKSISGALRSGSQADFTILGIGVDVEDTGTDRTKLDTSYSDMKRNGAEPQLGHVPGPSCNMSPAAPPPPPNTKAKHEFPTMRSPSGDNRHQQQRLSNRDINRPPISSTNGARLCCSSGSLESEVSASAGDLQRNLDLDKAPRPTVRPLPALPELNGTRSASKSGGKPSPPPPPLITVSNTSLTPHNTDTTEFRSTDRNKNNTAMARAATISPTPATFNTHNPQLRCTPQGRMVTSDKDQSEEDIPTPTVPFPMPRRSKTLGIPPLSRDAKPPPLSIPPVNRLSFKGFAEGTARLSPSVIIRPPPLPLVNLPVLVPSPSRATVAGTEGTGRDEKRRTRVMMSMPALPLQGSSRGTTGHEEVDDLEDDDEEEGEDDEADEGVSGRSSFSSSSHIETPRSSFDSVTSVDDDVIEKLSTMSPSQTCSSASSYETARAEPSPSFWGPHQWDSPSSSKLSLHQPQVVGTQSTGGIGIGLSTVLDRKSIGELDSSGLDGAEYVGVVRGKAKQEIGDDEGMFGDVVFPSMQDLAGVPNSKDHGGRDSETGLKVVATPDAKVAHSYGSGRLVLERVASGSGSAERGRLDSKDPSPSDAKTGVSPRHLPLEPLLAAGSNTMTVEGSNPPPGDHVMESNNRLSITGSQKLDNLRLSGIGHHNGMYKRLSRSLVDIHAMATKEKVGKMVRDQEEEEERKRSSRVLRVSASCRKGNEGASLQDTGKEVEGCLLGHSDSNCLNLENSTLSSGSSGQPAIVDRVTSVITASPRGSSVHPLRRRRSMPVTEPPSYSGLFTGIPLGLGMEIKLQPREDEGKEKLPAYSNDIFLTAVMPRKMEFTSPGVQAKDRKWRQVLCVLDGTALRVYKCAPRAGVSAWWENKVGAGDPLMDSGPSSSWPRTTVRNYAASDSREPGGALSKEIELARAKRNGEVGKVGRPLIDNGSVDRSQQLRSYSPLLKPQGRSHHQQQSSVSQGVTKSALTLAVQLLKPSATKYSRSSSDASRVSGPLPSSSRPQRASLDIPRTTVNAQTRNDGSQSHLAPSSLPGRQSSRPRPLTPASGGRPDQAKTKKGEEGAEPDENDLIRVYTMQHAESGLGKDYTKRPHVIRVRLEGEQFLLQAKNVESVIAWIEGLQCSANVALDLDERPMPTGPIIPRRRRRRRAAAAVPRSHS